MNEQPLLIIACSAGTIILVFALLSLYFRNPFLKINVEYIEDLISTHQYEDKRNDVQLTNYTFIIPPEILDTNRFPRFSNELIIVDHWNSCIFKVNRKTFRFSLDENLETV